MKYLLFDYGGVLVDLQRERCLAAFDELGLDIRPYLGTYQQAGTFSLLEDGKISIADFCQALRQLAGNATLSDAAIVQAWESYLLDVPRERLALLLKIRQHYPLAALSNTNPIHWQQSLRLFFGRDGHSIEDYFDHTFLSYELHIQKPHYEIFQLVIDRLKCQPNEILFFDDSEENCRAARCCGLYARLAPPNGGWTKDFDENGKLKPATIDAILQDV